MTTTTTCVFLMDLSEIHFSINEPINDYITLIKSHIFEQKLLYQILILQLIWIKTAILLISSYISWYYPTHKNSLTKYQIFIMITIFTSILALYSATMYPDTALFAIPIENLNLTYDCCCNHTGGCDSLCSHPQVDPMIPGDGDSLKCCECGGEHPDSACKDCSCTFHAGCVC